jgi:hypothetical protein
VKILCLVKRVVLKLALFMFFASLISPKTTGDQTKVRSTPKAYAAVSVPYPRSPLFENYISASIYHRLLPGDNVDIYLLIECLYLALRARANRSSK